MGVSKRYSKLTFSALLGSRAAFAAFQRSVGVFSRSCFPQPFHLTMASQSTTTAVDSSSDNNNVPNHLPRIDAVETVASSKWLSLKVLDYTDASGKARKWELASRMTKSTDDAADAVVIVPLLKKAGSNAIDTLLVEQYRPPVRQATVEFPAGLIDKDETPIQAALRELREETGYVGERCRVVPQVSRPVCMSPGLCDETVLVVVVDVDLDNPYNHGTPKAEPDEGEHITIKRVPLQEGLRTVLDNGSSMPIMGLYLFALGLELGKGMDP